MLIQEQEKIDNFIIYFFDVKNWLEKEKILNKEKWFAIMKLYYKGGYR